MMKTTNFNGTLNSDGSIRVEKSNIQQEIVFIKGREVHLRNRKGNKYVAPVHKRLDLTFCEVGDIAFIKFKYGQPYIVGFRKEMRK